jgi:hypothetical protein
LGHGGARLGRERVPGGVLSLVAVETMRKHMGRPRKLSPIADFPALPCFPVSQRIGLAQIDGDLVGAPGKAAAVAISSRRMSSTMEAASTQISSGTMLT